MVNPDEFRGVARGVGFLHYATDGSTRTQAGVKKNPLPSVGNCCTLRQTKDALGRTARKFRTVWESQNENSLPAAIIFKMPIPWNRGQPLSAGAGVTFEEMYPKLRDVSIEYEERVVFRGDDFTRPSKNEIFSAREMGPNVRCGNQNCNGGYLFQSVIDSMVESGQSVKEGRMRCEGTERVVRGQELGV